MRRRRDERGSAAIFLIGFAIVLVVAAGMVIDGGLAINKRMRVADDAEQAARAGANEIDIDRLRETGEIVLDQRLAKATAKHYLATLGYGAGQSDITVDQPPNSRVRVELRDTQDSFLLQLIMISSFDVRAGADAEPNTGN